MLWFDNSKDDLGKKVQRAVDYYTKKYNRVPDTCVVHFKDVEKKIQIGDISIYPDKYILLHHYWLGIEEKEGI